MENELSPITIENLSPGEWEEAQNLREEIDTLTDTIVAEETGLSTHWVQLGVLTHQIRTKKHWITLGYGNFGEFVEHIGKKVHKGRSQIYQYVTVAEKLLPQLGAEKLAEIGITNANELKKLAVASGKQIPEDILGMALDPKKDTDQLKAEIAKLAPGTAIEKGKWYDMGGFYVTDEEKLLIQTAFKCAMGTDPVIKNDIPEHIQKKEVVLRLAMEYLSTYGESNEPN